jgi:hypothetical protein
MAKKRYDYIVKVHHAILNRREAAVTMRILRKLVREAVEATINLHPDTAGRGQSPTPYADRIAKELIP